MIYKKGRIKAVKDDGTVEAIIATLNVIDKDGDVTLPGFFGSEPQWAHVVPTHDWDHVWMGKASITEEGDKVVARARMNLDIQSAKEWHSALKFDLENGKPKGEWSYGFNVLDGARKEGQMAGRHVSFLGPVEDGGPGVDTHEISPVILGAGEGTGTRSVKGKKTFSDEADSVLAAIEGFIKRAKSLADLRAKDGRCLSAENMEKIKGVYTGVNSITESLDAILVDDDADAKAQARRIFADRARRGR